MSPPIDHTKKYKTTDPAVANKFILTRDPSSEVATKTQSYKYIGMVTNRAKYMMKNSLITTASA